MKGGGMGKEGNGLKEKRKENKKRKRTKQAKGELSQEISLCSLAIQRVKMANLLVTLSPSGYVHSTACSLPLIWL